MITILPAPLGEVVTCIHGHACGACGLLGETYGAELERKRKTLAAALKGQASLKDVVVAPTLASPRAEGYRNRAKMAAGFRAGRGVLLGYFREGTRSIVDAPECRVLEPALLPTLAALRAFLSRNAARMPLRFVDLRCGTDPVRQHLTLVFDAEVAGEIPLAEIRRACSAVSGISYNLNPGRGNKVIKGAIHHAWGEREVWVDVTGARLRVSPASFFQVNLHLLPVLHERMREFLGQGRVLADLYAGVGTHGLALASEFGRVLLVEGAASSSRDAKASAERVGLSHASVLARPVERALHPILASKPEAFVLNPSREGARRDVLEAIASSRARRVAYLSCDPVTLARDLDVLVMRGLRLDSVQAVDMMPQTLQVEALALLSRSPVPRGRPAKPRDRSGQPRDRSGPPRGRTSKS